MSDNMLNFLTEEWSDMSGKALSLQEIPPEEMQRLLRDTYETLEFYHKFGLVPKAVLKLLFEMDHYLYFSTIMKAEDEPGSFPYYRAVNTIVGAIEDAFFQEKNEHVFPELKICNPTTETATVFDFDKDKLKDLM